MPVVQLDDDGTKVEARMPSQGAPVSTAEQESQKRKIEALLRLQTVIDQAMAGTLPRDRELQPHELLRLGPQHVQLVLDRAAGYNITECAARAGITANYAGYVLQHPDAQTILSTILSLSADKLTDMNERLKHLAPEALNVKVELMRIGKQEETRQRAATDILALAGYGTRKSIHNEVNINSKNRLVLPAESAKGLVEALKLAASTTGNEDYSRYIAKSTMGDEIVAEHKQLSDELQPSAEHTVVEDGASPIPSPSLDAADEESSPEMERALAEEAEARLELKRRTA